MNVTVAIPVKPFDAAKQRLSSHLTPAQRRSLSIELASRTARAGRDAGAIPLILSADDEVTAWAKDAGYEVLLDQGSNLNEAAAAGVRFALPGTWLLCHADLPLITSMDIKHALSGLGDAGWVVSPSSDGGTSLIGGSDSFDFSFGTGSFHRHMARLGGRRTTVLNRLGMLLDLDTDADLRAAATHPRGAWLDAVIG